MRPERRAQGLRGACAAGCEAWSLRGVVGAAEWGPRGSLVVLFQAVATGDFQLRSEPAWVGALQTCSSPERRVTPP